MIFETWIIPAIITTLAFVGVHLLAFYVASRIKPADDWNDRHIS
jgi:hypothetical protein